jgi:hypothetical protein
MIGMGTPAAARKQQNSRTEKLNPAGESPLAGSFLGRRC